MEVSVDKDVLTDVKILKQTTSLSQEKLNKFKTSINTSSILLKAGITSKCAMKFYMAIQTLKLKTLQEIEEYLVDLAKMVGISYSSAKRVLTLLCEKEILCKHSPNKEVLRKNRFRKKDFYVNIKMKIDILQSILGSPYSFNIKNKVAKQSFWYFKSFQSQKKKIFNPLFRNPAESSSSNEAQTERSGVVPLGYCDRSEDLADLFRADLSCPAYYE